MSKVRILYATSECVPFAYSGGLGEVAGSLPGAINSRQASQSSPQMECRVIMPLYRKISDEFRSHMKLLGSTTVVLNWRHQECDVYELEQDNVIYYFIDNEYYFDRDNLYGYYDDGERFAFFSKAVMECNDITGYVPDIIHANDWQTALIPVLQTAEYKRASLKTVFSCHNIEYQGYLPYDFFIEVLDLPEEYRCLAEFNWQANLMKGGIEACNVFSTVSPTYAGELQTPEAAFGLDGIIRNNAGKLKGILNGINTTLYDPEHDSLIAANFSADDMSGKAICKKALQDTAGLPRRDVPVFTLISRLVPAKGMDLVWAVMDEVLESQDIQFVMLGTGFPEYEEFFKGLQERHPSKASCMIKFDSALSHVIYAGGDVLMVPSRSEPCGLTQMIGCRYADIPLVRATGGLNDSITDCTEGEGNGFVFQGYDPESLRGAIMNAITKYNDRESWAKLAEHALREDFSWAASAEEYAQMYAELAQS